jgi:hypothetical protein
MNRLSKTFKIIIAICAISLPSFVVAQGFGDDSPCSGENNVDDVPCPFDGGVTLLVMAGVGYGLKKARDTKNMAKY